MPDVIVRFFGPARDIAGVSEMTLSVGDAATVGDVRLAVTERHPALKEDQRLRFALNRRYVRFDEPVSAGDEIAVIPPVSGGADAQRVMLTSEPIDAEACRRMVERPDAGAITSFLGTVREESAAGKRLVALDYHAYEDMALEQMSEIRSDAIEGFGLRDAVVVHRLGRLAIGEASICVVVASGHRSEAFDACRWIVDEVKRDVPIWKQDVWSDGTRTWVDPKS